MYFIELHKAKMMYTLVRNQMELLDKCGIAQPLKVEMKTNLNKISQFLTLKDLKVIDEQNIRYNTVEAAVQ